MEWRIFNGTNKQRSKIFPSERFVTVHPRFKNDLHMEITITIRSIVSAHKKQLLWPTMGLDKIFRTIHFFDGAFSCILSATASNFYETKLNELRLCKKKLTTILFGTVSEGTELSKQYKDCSKSFRNSTESFSIP